MNKSLQSAQLFLVLHPAHAYLTIHLVWALQTWLSISFLLRKGKRLHSGVLLWNSRDRILCQALPMTACWVTTGMSLALPQFLYLWNTTINADFFSICNLLSINSTWHQWEKRLPQKAKDRLYVPQSLLHALLFLPAIFWINGATAGRWYQVTDILLLMPSKSYDAVWERLL